MYSTAIDKRQEDHDALGWKSKIRKAIQGKRVVPVYQPIVDATGMVQKYEALMRLRDEYTDSLIAPGQFLEVAVKTRLYEELSRQIMLETLQRITKTNYTATLNFTYGDIRNKDLLFEIESFLRENEGLSHRLVFEITESESIENYDDMKGFINKFREFGVKFAVDDFGSGFSNFDYILAIRPDFLKIDGSLVKTIEHNERSFILVKAIVQFSHEFGIEVIAEFVHSERVFEMLKKIGVDAFQGFYFSEPLLDFKA
jgi:EAL domain-containing protein (putative c-di-GMP-specific phosphodiesterase class I)